MATRKKPTKRSPNYSEEIRDKICSDIVVHGIIEDAYGSQGVSKQVYYKWLKRHPDFREAIASARENYRTNRRIELVDKVQNKVEKLALEGYDERWHNVKKTYRVMPDGTHKLIELVDEEKSYKRPPLPWAVDKIMGKEVDEINALRLLYKNGWFSEAQMREAEKLFHHVDVEMKKILGGQGRGAIVEVQASKAD